jgi:hypothetical protein
MITRLGIIFNDNDFSHTVHSFLEIISKALLHCDAEKHINYTKERIVEHYNKVVVSLYLLCQSSFSYDVDWKDAQEYLAISVENVYLNYEVAAFLRKTPWCNNEFHFMCYDSDKGEYVIDSI